MNHQLQKFARDTLKEGLNQLPSSNQLFFKKMYSPKDLEKSIEDVVDAMLESELDLAMDQVHRTLVKYSLV